MGSFQEKRRVKETDKEGRDERGTEAGGEGAQERGLHAWPQPQGARRGRETPAAACRRAGEEPRRSRERGDSRGCTEKLARTHARTHTHTPGLDVDETMSTRDNLNVSETIST